ncbi:hypothetical protein FB451DRAFT_1372337 [Mycena latifolia]|nr:hypothetical protein FB451DRAFT_1372337 [Mycena latifolia]
MPSCPSVVESLIIENASEDVCALLLLPESRVWTAALRRLSIPLQYAHAKMLIRGGFPICGNRIPLLTSASLRSVWGSDISPPDKHPKSIIYQGPQLPTRDDISTVDPPATHPNAEDSHQISVSRSRRRDARTKELFYLESRHGRPHSAPAVRGTSTFEAPSIGGYPTRIQSPRSTTNSIERQLRRPLAGASSETFRACQLFITAARTTTRTQPPHVRSTHPVPVAPRRVVPVVAREHLKRPVIRLVRRSEVRSAAQGWPRMQLVVCRSSTSRALRRAQGHWGARSHATPWAAFARSGSSPPRRRGPGRCGRRSPQTHASRQAMARHLSMRQGLATSLAAGYGALREPRPQPLDLRVNEGGAEAAGGEVYGPYNIIRNKGSPQGAPGWVMSGRGLQGGSRPRKVGGENELQCKIGRMRSD